MLQYIRSAGIKAALGSFSKNAEVVVQKLGIAELLDAVADGDSVTQFQLSPAISTEDRCRGVPWNVSTRLK